MTTIDILYSQQPKIMGIVNATPDSFSGSYGLDDIGLDEVDIVDVGGYSTRPGHADVPLEEEWSRVAPVLKRLRELRPDICVSLDTFRAEIARRGVEEYGVDIINDISSGTLDVDMFPTVAKLGVPYVLTHFEEFRGGDIVGQAIVDLSRKVYELRQLGVKDIIIDPGFGFKKTVDQNFEILSRLSEFGIFNMPLLVGISRKSMIFKTLECSPMEAINGTTVLNTFSLLNGANILRVHDVRQAREAITLIEKLKH